MTNVRKLFDRIEDVSEGPEIKTKRSGIDESIDKSGNHFATLKSKSSALDLGRSRADTEFQANLFDNLIGDTRNLINDINEKEDKVQNILAQQPVID